MTLSTSSRYPASTPEEEREQRYDIYRKLAPLYDLIMHGVDYPDWTDYIDTIIRYHHPHATKLLELACGTGTMALFMEKRDDYEITATDISPEMIRIAGRKGETEKSKVEWLVRDMRRIELSETFDIIYMVFDSLNYLHNEKDIHAVLESARQHLKPDGSFIFDFTTPNYSPVIAPLLNEERNVNEHYSYRRFSNYDHLKQMHINHFLVEKKDRDTGKITDRFEEIHQQRIWSFDEIMTLIAQSNLVVDAAYEDFDLSAADENSERITMVLKHG